MHVRHLHYIDVLLFLPLNGGMLLQLDSVLLFLLHQYICVLPALCQHGVVHTGVLLMPCPQSFGMPGCIHPFL